MLTGLAIIRYPTSASWGAGGERACHWRVQAKGDSCTAMVGTNPSKWAGFLVPGEVLLDV